MNLIVCHLDQPPIDCGICHMPECVPPHNGFCLPVYEGQVDFRSKVCVPACESCYNKYAEGVQDG